jgi:DNA-binding transcriptional LysR family regulator
MDNRHLILAADRSRTVIQKTERGVQQIEHPAGALAKDVNWDDLKLLEALASVSSFRRAAGHFGVSVNTVRSRLSRLEQQLGCTLFRRSRDGIALSSEGERVVALAGSMRRAGTGGGYAAGDRTTVAKDQIRISCSEGLGEFWLTPRLPALQEQLPGVTICLQNEFDQDRIHRRDRDICLGFNRPSDRELIVSKIACLHFALYASQAYLDTYGQPKSMDEALSHRFVFQDAPGLRSDIAELFIGQAQTEKLVAVRVNTSYSLYRAVVDGVGIGALPTYVRTVTRKVKPIDLAIQLKFDLWLSYDHAARKSDPVRRTIGWVRDSFDQGRYPWFADKFINPFALEEHFASADVIPFDNDCRFA